MTMTFNRRPVWFASAATALALGLAACAPSSAGGPSTTSAEPEQDSIQINIGYQSHLWGSTLILAEASGAWEKAGLDVNSQGFAAGADVRDAILGGSIDIGSIGSPPFLIAAANGDVEAIATAGWNGDTAAVIVSNESGVESLEDLAGKGIGSRTGSITELGFLQDVLPSVGLGPDDVELRNITFEDQVAALTANQVDAVVGIEPYNSIAVSRGVGTTLIEFGDYNLLPNILAVRSDFIAENPELVERVLAAYYETTEWVEQNLDEAVGLLYDYFSEQGLSIDEETLGVAFLKIGVYPGMDEELTTYLKDQAAMLADEGRLASEPSWDEVLRLDLQEKAMTPYWAERDSSSRGAL